MTVYETFLQGIRNRTEEIKVKFEEDTIGCRKMMPDTFLDPPTDLFCALCDITIDTGVFICNSLIESEVWPMMDDSRREYVFYCMPCFNIAFERRFEGVRPVFWLRLGARQIVPKVMFKEQPEPGSKPRKRR